MSIEFSMDLTEVKMLLNEKIEYYKKNQDYYGGNAIPFDTRDYMALLVAVDVVNEEIERRGKAAKEDEELKEQLSTDRTE